MLPQVYGLPFGMTKHFQARVGDPLRAKLSGASGPVLPKWRAAKRSVARAVTCCGFIGPVHEEKDLTVRLAAAVDVHVPALLIDLTTYVKRWSGKAGVAP